jgi:hypothetical protein
VGGGGGVKVNNTVALATATYEAYSPNEDPVVVMHVRKERTVAAIQDVVCSKLPNKDSFTVSHTGKGKGRFTSFNHDRNGNVQLRKSYIGNT